MMKKAVQVITNADFFVFLAVLGLYFFSALVFFPAFLDDPFITFRYGKNLALGHGLVWNPGEAPVEGYTSTLWVLLGALSVKLNIFPILTAKLLGVLSAVTGLGVIIFGLKKHLPSLIDRASIALLFASSFEIVFYSVSAMENIVFMLITLLLYPLLSRDQEQKSLFAPVLAAFAAGTGCWIRPEAHALAVLLAGYFFLEERSKPLLKQKRFWVFTLLTALIVVPLDLWRIFYYGDFFPNTYYAKHTGGTFLNTFFEAAKYLSERFSPYFIFALLFCLYAVRNLKDRLTCFFTVLFTVYFCYVLKVGGDDHAAFAGARLMLPVIPILMIYSVRAVRSFVPGKVQAVFCITCMVLFFQLSELTVYFHAYKTRVNRVTTLSEISFNKILSDAGNYWDYLNRPEISPMSKFFIAHTPRGEAIAIPWAGLAPYETGLKVIDLLGLNDRHIARQPKKQRGVDVKFDMEYVLAQKPYFVCENLNLGRYSMKEISEMGPEDYYEAGAWKAGQRELLASPLLRQFYEVDKRIDSREITCFKRRDA